VSAVVEIAITFRIDPSDPTLGGGPTFYGDLVGRPVLVIGNLDATDPARIGEVVIALLRNADQDEQSKRNPS
jgi:hypothetical protein